MDSFAVFPSLPVPDDDDGQGRGLVLRGKPDAQFAVEPEHIGHRPRPGHGDVDFGQRHGCGIGAMFCGGVPNTVARNAAESARPVAGPGAGGGWMGAPSANVTGESNNPISARTMRQCFIVCFIADSPAVRLIRFYRRRIFSVRLPRWGGRNAPPACTVRSTNRRRSRHD